MKKTLLTIAFAMLLPAQMLKADEARLLRFPTIGGGNIVFSFAGNLYRVPEQGGAAVKLTSDVGYESFAKISPDGKTIAFTAQYDGNTEVYTMPIEGGEPKRITWSALVERDKMGERMGPNNIVMGWTPDGTRIVYRSKQWCFSGLRAQLCTVPVEGGMPEYIPTSEGGFCSFSPDGTQLAMNRMFREFRTWKYYRGGQADDIWIHQVGTTQIERIPGCDAEAQDIFPMWVGDEIYYFSDRDRTMNLFAYDTKSKQTRKVTDFTEYDCKFPSCSQKSIVFENGGYIYKYDVASRKCAKVSITLADDDIYSRSEIRNVGNDLSGASLSPDGKRVVAIARGDVWSLPAEQGPVYNVTRSPESHEREVTWSPDGSRVAWLSDAGGEYQVWVAPSSDLTKAEPFTQFESGYLSGLQWSPDGSKLYFRTEKRDIWELDAKSKKAERLLVSETSGFRRFSLSPDGKWAAYSEELPNKMSAVFLFDMEKKTSYQLTDRWYDASQPLFSQDGRYLFFTSSRALRAQYSSVEWNASYNVSDYVFMVPLASETPNPLSLSSDEYKADDKKEKKEKEPKHTKVDLEGIGQRITALPMDAGFYRLLLAPEGKLYFSGSGNGVKAFDLASRKVSEVSPVVPIAITADGKKALVRPEGRYSVANFGGRGDQPIPTDAMDMIINHEAEWKQIFDESWRITRDNFYVENMHGLDWQKIHDKYAALLPWVKHRDDLTYLIGEMIGELNVGHAYITSGETPSIPRIATGLLGARLSRDEATGAFRIDHIFQGADWDKELVSPLTAPGVEAKEGDYITAINGVPASEYTAIGQALVNKVGKTVALELAANASGKDSRVVYVKPIASEIQLAYHEWVQRNIAIVNEASNGEIGYIHIPDMSVEGLDAFTKLYYTQLDKRALIVDDRMNGGGNVSPMILERLQREVYRVSMYRNGANEPVPNEAFYGPMVCLIDKYSSSDGDLFPYGFRKLGLGKLIGKRTWGGIVGISGSRPFVDGQDMRTPFFTSYSTEGEWIIEGHGVDPDIEVDINPFEDYLGNDAQLLRAVEELQQELKNWKPLPPTPADPDKSK